MISLDTSTSLTSALFREPVISACFGAEATLSRYLAFEIGLSEAWKAHGRLDRQTADRAITAMQEFRSDLTGIVSAQDRDGLPVPEFVRQLKTHCGEHADAVHLGATSQDLMDTATVLALRDVNAKLETRLTALITALETLMQTHGSVPLMGRTRMQAALPVHVADRMRPWIAGLRRARMQLDGMSGDLYVLQLGGPVGAGVGDTPELSGKIANHVAKALGLGVPESAWHTERSRFVAYGHWLVRLTGTLGKAGIDIALMAQQGIDAIRLSGGGGSSAMPHKQNPVLAEKLITIARQVNILGGALGEAMIHEQERSGVAWMAEWLTLPQMCELAGRAMNDALALVGSIEHMGEQPPSR